MTVNELMDGSDKGSENIEPLKLMDISKMITQWGSLEDSIAAGKVYFILRYANCVQ